MISRTSFPRQSLNTKSFCWPIIITPVYKWKLLLAEFTEKRISYVNGEKHSLFSLLAVTLFWSTHSLFETEFTYMERPSCWGWGEGWGLDTITHHRHASPFCKNQTQKDVSQIGSDAQFLLIPGRGPTSWLSLLSCLTPSGFPHVIFWIWNVQGWRMLGWMFRSFQNPHMEV